MRRISFFAHPHDHQCQVWEAATQAPPPVQAAAAARVILFVTVFLDLLGFGIVIPLLPMFANRLGISAVGIGAILAIYSLAQFVCAPILGRISDRIGRRPVIIWDCSAPLSAT